MTDQATIEPTIIPTQQAAGFVAPSVGPDGAPLSMREQFEALKANPAFVAEALIPHTPAAAWVAKMNAEAAGLDPLAPPVGPGPSAPATPPEAFTIPYPHGSDGSPEHAAADGIVRGWLVASGVDRETGNSLASLAVERIAHWEGVADRSNAAAEAEAVLRDVYREDYEPRIEAAQRYVVHIESKSPGFGEFLNRTGLANDATFIHRMATLAMQRGV